MSKRELIKEMYINNKNVEDICARLSISRGTFYYHKKEDLKKDINWEDLKYIKATNVTDLKDKEKEFLSVLIYQYEKALNDIKKIDDPIKRIEALQKYVSSYYKLKTPNKDDCKSKVAQIGTATIYAISNIAIDEKNKEVIEFLAKNTNNIVEAILSSKNSKAS